jgi:hypothetical protein
MGRETSDERDDLLPAAGRSFPHKKAEESFSVAAFVREITARSQRGAKQRVRGRPRRGMPKVLNEKKIISSMKKELGLR